MSIRSFNRLFVGKSARFQVDFRIVRISNRSFRKTILPSKTTFHSFSCFSTTSSPPVNSAARVLIIGCGISGLTAAHYLSTLPVNLSKTRPSITIVDSSNDTGGWIQTLHTDDNYLFETGPRSLMTRNGVNTISLIDELNLQSQIIHSNQLSKRRFLYNSNTNHLILTPTGFNQSLFIFPYLKPLVLGILNDLLLTKKTYLPDETIYSFISRQFNVTIANELIDPLTAGIYAGDINRLSIRSCFPRLFDENYQFSSIIWKRIYDSIFNKTPESEEIKQFLSQDWIKELKKSSIYGFQNGMKTLSDTLTNSLNKNIKLELNSFVSSISIDPDSKHWIVTINNHQQIYDYIISTISGVDLAKLLQSSIISTSNSDYSNKNRHCTTNSSNLSNNDQKVISSHYHQYCQTLQHELSSIVYANVIVVNVGYDEKVLKDEYSGFGFLCSSKHNITCPFLGITFDSITFPQQNHHQKQTRLTIMMCGDRHPDLINKTNNEIEQIVLEYLNKILNITIQPKHLIVHRQINCIPQYYVGHHQKIENITKQLNKLNCFTGKQHSLTILGNCLHSVSINDLITQSKKSAQILLETI